MQDATAPEVIAVAVLIPVLTAGALYGARAASRWFAKALARSFADTVSEVVAPDLSRLGVRLGTSIDELRTEKAEHHAELEAAIEELRTENRRQHSAVEQQLAELVERLTVLEQKADRRRRSDPPEGL